MSYNTKQLLKDQFGVPIPQYWDEATDSYKPLNDLKKVYAQGTLSDFRTAALTITSTSTEITAGLSGRNQLIIYPPDTGLIYWGQAGVSSSNGAVLKAGDLPMEFDFADTSLKIFAVSDGTNRQIRIVESK